LTLLLGACGDNGNGDNGGNGGQAATTATLVATSAAQAAAPTATRAVENQSDAITETEQAAGTTGITNGTDSGVADVAVITSTQLITGTEITTDVTVSTDTAVIEQQLITTVITNTDIVSNVATSNDSSTASETKVLTDVGELTPESTTGQGVANVAVTPLAPTATPTVVVQVTRVVTATAVVTNSVDVTAVATPQPGQSQGQGQATGAAIQAAGTVYTGVVDAQGKTILATTLLDSNFQTSDGEVSGEVQDLLINVQTGQVLYLLLEYGGVLDVGDTDLPAPLSAFSLKEDGELLLNIPPEDLQNFPDVGNDWPQADNADWDSSVRDFWSKEGFDVSADPAASSQHIRRVSDLLTGSVGDVGLGAGTVEDMLISLDQGRVAYVLLSFAGADANGGGYAVPLNAFDAENTENGLAFRSDFDGSLLQNAPRFNMADARANRFLPNDYDKDWQGYWNQLTNP